MSRPPLKLPFSQRRDREFLYLNEIDALIAATKQTRSPLRNSALALLLFTQALQPIELCWLRWCDVNFAEKILLITRNRSKSLRHQSQITINFQPMCLVELDLLQQLETERDTDWLFGMVQK